MEKYTLRQKTGKVDPKIDEQFTSGRLYGICGFSERLQTNQSFVIFHLIQAFIASRPGKNGRADGYVLEGKELEFYMKKLK